MSVSGLNKIAAITKKRPYQERLPVHPLYGEREEFVDELKQSNQTFKEAAEKLEFIYRLSQESTNDTSKN